MKASKKQIIVTAVASVAAIVTIVQGLAWVIEKFSKPEVQLEAAIEAISVKEYPAYAIKANRLYESVQLDNVRNALEKNASRHDIKLTGVQLDAFAESAYNVWRRRAEDFIMILYTYRPYGYFEIEIYNNGSLAAEGVEIHYEEILAWGIEYLDWPYAKSENSDDVSVVAIPKIPAKSFVSVYIWAKWISLDVLPRILCNGVEVTPRTYVPIQKDSLSHLVVKFVRIAERYSTAVLAAVVFIGIALVFRLWWLPRNRSVKPALGTSALHKTKGQQRKKRLRSKPANGLKE